MPILVANVSRQLKKIGPGLRRVLGNIGWLMVDRLIRMGMGLFVGVWVAQVFGTHRIRKLELRICVHFSFRVLGHTGPRGNCCAGGGSPSRETNEILGTAFALRLAAGLLAAAGSIPVLRLIQPHDRQALLLVSILSLTLIFQAFDTIDSFFQSQVRSKITVWAKNSAFLIFAAVRVRLIYIKAPVWMFAAAITGEMALRPLVW